MHLLNILCKLAQGYYTQKPLLPVVSADVIFHCNSETRGKFNHFFIAYTS